MVLEIFFSHHANTLITYTDTNSLLILDISTCDKTKVLLELYNVAVACASFFRSKIFNVTLPAAQTNYASFIMVTQLTMNFEKILQKQIPSMNFNLLIILFKIFFQLTQQHRAHQFCIFDSAFFEIDVFSSTNTRDNSKEFR